MPSTTHQAKKPYGGVHSQGGEQSCITNYFTVQPNGNSAFLSSSLSNSSSQRSTISSTPLPAAVQSNLLSVGMRIRKSVPEGYKTGSYSAFTLFSDSTTTPPHSQTSQRSAYNEIGYSAAKELTPFCGILKVGGLGIQQHVQYGYDTAVPGEDDLPFLSSQASTVSNISVRSSEQENGHKRRYDEDEDEDEDIEVVVMGQKVNEVWKDENTWDEELSPKSRPMNLGLGGRALAMPKSRRRTSGGVLKVGKAVGQENLQTDVSMDFGEAEFLDYGVLEVDMRDV